MIDLLLKIKSHLRVELSGVRDVDIFLSPNLEVIPPGIGFPAIGIKDGKVNRVELSSDVEELSLPVEIAVYERFIKDETAIINLHTIAGDVRAALKDELFDGYVKAISGPNETPVVLLARKDALILRKILSYTYEKEE